MTAVEKISETREIVKSWKRQGVSVGLVPTMGCLHDGHKSLIERARRENDRVVVSIFVNPTQFGPNEDFEKYPRNLERDLEICSGAGTDMVFAPTPGEIYPFPNSAFIDVAGLGDGLCGAARPGHFRGVCTIVAKLFNIVLPDRAYFGEKDAQQLAIIKRMAGDLNFDTEIVPCPIVREPDGLAMSSRNAYLSDPERKAALVISRSLDRARRELEDGGRNAQAIIRSITDSLNAEPLVKINYVEIVDSETLKPVSEIASFVLVAVAAYVGKTRLIDNFTFEG